MKFNMKKFMMQQPITILNIVQALADICLWVFGLISLIILILGNLVNTYSLQEAKAGIWTSVILIISLSGFLLVGYTCKLAINVHSNNENDIGTTIKTWFKLLFMMIVASTIINNVTTDGLIFYVKLTVIALMIRLVSHWVLWFYWRYITKNHSDWMSLKTNISYSKTLEYAYGTNIYQYVHEMISDDITNASKSGFIAKAAETNNNSYMHSVEGPLNILKPVYGPRNYDPRKFYVYPQSINPYTNM